MRRHALMIAVLAVAFASGGCNDATTGKEFFEATLSGANEVPARGTAAHGVAGFSFDGTTVNYSVEMDDTSGITVGHIHSGAAGVNGPVRVFLYPVPGTGSAPSITTSELRIAVQGSFTAANVTGVTFQELLSQMRAGTAYANFHSPTFPGGEIRGQVRQISVE